jgi:hypothetical protein
MKLADGPGDRWPRAIGAGGKSGHRRRRLARAGDEVPFSRLRRLRVKGNAPGNPRGRPRRLRCKVELLASACGVGFNPMRCGSVTESATENIPPAEQHGGIAQENLRDVFAKLVC